MSILKTYSYVFFAIFALASISGCGKNEDPAQPTPPPVAVIPFDLTDRGGDKFSDQKRTDKVSFIKNRLNIEIIVEDQSYANEYSVNRILRYLAANSDRLKSVLMDVVEIRIGTAFNRHEIIQGKISISLNTSASEAELDRYLSTLRTSYQSQSALVQLSTRLGLKLIVDQIGMTEDQIKAFSENFTGAVGGYDFTLPYAAAFTSQILVDRIFAVGNSYLVVPFDASRESIQSFFGAALQLSKHLSTDLANASKLLGVEVGYQQGVLLPEEIFQGITNLLNSVDLFQKAPSTKKAVLIGRRTETDPGIFKRSGTLLIAFNATQADITNAFLLLDADIKSPIHQLMVDFSLRYQPFGIDNLISENTLLALFPTDQGSVTAASSLLSQVAAVATPQRLSSLQVTQIQSTTYSSDESKMTPDYHGRATLSLNLSSFTPQKLESVIRAYETTYSQNTRLALQKKMISDLASFYYDDMRLDYSDSGLDLTTGDKTQALSAFIAVMRQVAPKARLKNLKVATISFSKGALSEAESVLLSGSTLTIDPYLATSRILESVLRAAEKALVPPPQPSPSPRD